MTWLFFILSAIGAILNARARISGFYVWIVANLCWVFYDFAIEEYAQSVLFIFYTGICIYGIVKWRKIRNADRP